MTFAILWVISATLLFALAYALGHQAGYDQGIRKGFAGALQRAVEVERPLELLRRVLVPRPDVPPLREKTKLSA